MGQFTTVKAEHETLVQNLSFKEAELDKRHQAMNELQELQAMSSKEALDLSETLRQRQEDLQVSQQANAQLKAALERRTDEAAAAIAARSTRLDVLATELEEQQQAVQCAQDKLQADRRDFHAAVWSHAAAGPPIQQGQMQQAAPPVVTHTPHRQHPWPTDPNWQPVQPSSPSFGLASELGEVMSDLDHWVCHACGRIYDNTIKDCTCQQDSPIKANQCDWLTKEAAKVYLLEIGETAVQSLKWAHEPKTEVTPKEVYAYAKAQVAEADLAILPKRVCETVISRRLLPAIAQLKPQASPQAHRYLLQQDLSSDR
jgi:hypothetical protein